MYINSLALYWCNQITKFSISTILKLNIKTFPEGREAYAQQVFHDCSDVLPKDVFLSQTRKATILLDQRARCYSPRRLNHLPHWEPSSWEKQASWKREWSSHGDSPECLTKDLVIISTVTQRCKVIHAWSMNKHWTIMCEVWGHTALRDTGVHPTQKARDSFEHSEHSV